MSNTPETPLAIIAEELWEYTDRFPRINTNNVVATIQSALHTLEQPGQLVQRLVKGLDVQTPGGLGIVGVQGIESIGRLPLDTVSQAKTWGAISLLGMLAMTYDAKLHFGPAKDKDLAPFRAQLAALTARESLFRIKEAAELDSEQQKLITALLAHQEIPPEDVAIELLDLVPPDTDIASEMPQEMNEEVVMGASIGRPCASILDMSDQNITKKITAMSWVKSGFDFATQEITGYPIYKDGQEVAVMYDLTVVNTKLQKISKEVKSSHVKRKFWNILANSVVAALESRHKLIQYSIVNPTYSVGRNARNENLVRAYYVPLGRTGAGIQRFGLIAACRTKKRQADVMRLITDGNKSVEGS